MRDLGMHLKNEKRRRGEEEKMGGAYPPSVNASQKGLTYRHSELGKTSKLTSRSSDLDRELYRKNNGWKNTSAPEDGRKHLHGVEGLSSYQKTPSPGVSGIHEDSLLSTLDQEDPQKKNKNYHPNESALFRLALLLLNPTRGKENMDLKKKKKTKKRKGKGERLVGQSKQGGLRGRIAPKERGSFHHQKKDYLFKREEGSGKIPHQIPNNSPPERNSCSTQ